MSKQIDFSKPLSDEDAEYVRQRSWMLEDAKLSGYDVRFASEVDEDEAPEDPEDDNPSQDDEIEEDDEVDYNDLTVKELKAEIAARNEERDEDDQIQPESDRKDDLVAALVASDEDDTEE